MKIKLLIVALFALASTGASAQLTLGPAPTRPAFGPLTPGQFTAMLSDLPVPSGKTCTHATATVLSTGDVLVDLTLSGQTQHFTAVISPAQFATFVSAGNALPTGEVLANIKGVSIGSFQMSNGSATPTTEMVQFSL